MKLAAVAAAFAGAMSLGGCAGLGDGYVANVFVDPAKFDLYDCERLKTTRESLVIQIAEKQALIDKAKTGTAGTLVGEAVYRSDYIALKAQKKSADEYWQRNGCDAVMAPPPAAPKKKR